MYAFELAYNVRPTNNRCDFLAEYKILLFIIYFSEEIFTVCITFIISSKDGS